MMITPHWHPCQQRNEAMRQPISDGSFFSSLLQTIFLIFSNNPMNIVIKTDGIQRHWNIIDYHYHYYD